VEAYGAKEGFAERLGEAWRQGKRSEAAEIVRGEFRSGQPLSGSLRGEMEGHFGRDLSAVRLHTGGRAASAAEAVKANAFTVGQRIVFGTGRFEPHTTEGRLRLTHELAHTLQQKESARAGLGHGPGVEEEAMAAAVLGHAFPGPLTSVAEGIQREPTYPRRATEKQMMALAKKVLSLKRNKKSKNETIRKWSNISTNFGDVTAGSIARRIWTALFLLHFTLGRGGGEDSRHPRYFYSHQYGWIDGQHFFGFIDFAEAHYNKRKNKKNRRRRAFKAATRQGHKIEKRQQMIRKYIILQREPARGPMRHMQVRPPKTPLFRAPVATAGAITHKASRIAGKTLLSGTQGQLYKQLNETQRNKFFMDSAKSAFTFEDFISNQLGTRFFFKHGIAINEAPEADREKLFLSALSSFFSSIKVETSQKKVNKLARGLPSIERFEAPKTTEARDRKKHPELFRPPK